jgi:non-ribosomal peptide synthetase component F
MGANLEYLAFDNDIAMVDLSVAMAESDKGVVGTAKYNMDIFDESTITALFRRFDALLRSAVNDTNERVAHLRLAD